MTILYRMVLLVCLLLTGCQTMAVAAGGPTGNTKGWQAHRVQVGDRIVQFTIPPGESKEFLPFKVPQKLDLNGSDVFDEALLGPRVLERTWDYRASRFTAVDGTLDAYISVNRSEHDLIDNEAIQRAIEESSQRFAKKMLKEEGRSRAPNPPVKFESVRIDGREWLRVSYRLSGQYYITPLDGHHYLKVSVDVGGFTRQDWRADAQAAADAILRSIRIEDL